MLLRVAVRIMWDQAHQLSGSLWASGHKDDPMGLTGFKVRGGGWLLGKQSCPFLALPAFIYCPVSFLIPFHVTTLWALSGSLQLACQFGWASPRLGPRGPGWT